MDPVPKTESVPQTGCPGARASQGLANSSTYKAVLGQLNSLSSQLTVVKREMEKIERSLIDLRGICRIQSIVLTLFTAIQLLAAARSWIRSRRIVINKME